MNLSSFMPKDLVYPKAAACLTEEEKKDYIEKISGLLKEQNAAVIAHYYCNDDVQALAESTGGFIGDSLEMAKWGKKSSFVLRSASEPHSSCLCQYLCRCQGKGRLGCNLFNCDPGG